MNNIFWPFFVYIWALTYRLYEIEVEAKFGWAKKLPVLNIIKNGKVKFHFSEKTAPTIIESDSFKNNVFLIMQMRA